MTRAEGAEAGEPSFARYLTLALAILAALWVLGYLPTRRLAGEEGLVAMLAGSAVALAASLLGTLPLYLARHRPPTEMTSAILGTTATRLVAALALTLSLLLSGLFVKVPFLVWVALSHGGLLVADTFHARAQLRARDGATKK